MSSPANTAHPRPFRHAYKPIVSDHTIASIAVILAGCTFTAASATTNFLYGVGKSPELPQQIVWGAMAVAASVALALAPSVILRAISRRSFFGVLTGLTVLTLFGAFSLTSALGSAFGNRTASQSEVTAIEDARSRLTTAYDAAQVELSTLAATRPIGELEAEIAKLKATPGSNGCTKEPDGPISFRICRQAGLDSIELGRAQRRAELEKASAEAAERLSALPAARIANADATALSAFALKLGIAADAEQVKPWLALLAVLLLEFGGGLCFAVCGQLMADQYDAKAAERRTAESEMPEEASIAAEASVLDGPLSRAAEELTAAPATVAIAAQVVADLPGRIVAMLKSYGSDLLGSNRTIATALGCSPTEAGEALDGLATAGAVTVTRSKGGDSLRLAAA